MIRLVMTIVGLIVRLYPARFRARFDRELVDSIRDDLDLAATHGGLSLTGASARAVAEVLAGLVAERRSEFPAMRFTLDDDVADAIRSLRQSPTFTAVALFVLALGIGASTAIFSVVDAVVLRGLPFDRHDRLISVNEHNPKQPKSVGSTMPQIYLDWRIGGSRSPRSRRSTGRSTACATRPGRSTTRAACA